MKKTINLPLSSALGAALLTTVTSTGVNADTNPFGATELSAGYMQIAEAKNTTEMSCGASMNMAKPKTPEGACAGNTKAANGTSTEGTCGAMMKDGKMKPGMEAACGAMMKGKEGACGNMGGKPQ